MIKIYVATTVNYKNGPGAWCATVYIDGKAYKSFAGSKAKTMLSEMCLSAIITTVKKLETEDLSDAHLFLDNESVAAGIRDDFARTFKSMGWKNEFDFFVNNRALWKELGQLMKERGIDKNNVHLDCESTIHKKLIPFAEQKVPEKDHSPDYWAMQDGGLLVMCPFCGTTINTFPDNIDANAKSSLSLVDDMDPNMPQRCMGCERKLNFADDDADEWRKQVKKYIRRRLEEIEQAKKKKKPFSVEKPVDEVF